jgi:hypothetical protein
LLRRSPALTWISNSSNGQRQHPEPSCNRRERLIWLAVLHRASGTWKGVGLPLKRRDQISIDTNLLVPNFKSSATWMRKIVNRKTTALTAVKRRPVDADGGGARTNVPDVVKAAVETHTEIDP